MKTSTNESETSKRVASAGDLAPNWSALFNELPDNVRTIGVAMELKTRIQQLAMEKERLKAHYQKAIAEVNEHMGNCERSLAALSFSDQKNGKR